VVNEKQRQNLLSFTQNSSGPFAKLLKFTNKNRLFWHASQIGHTFVHHFKTHTRVFVNESLLWNSLCRFRLQLATHDVHEGFDSQFYEQKWLSNEVVASGHG